MGWNYRVMRRVWEKETSFSIYEIYYDKNNNVKMSSVEPIAPTGETLE